MSNHNLHLPRTLRPGQWLLAVALAVFGLTATSCTDQCEYTSRYVFYEPVYTSLENIRSEFGIEPAQNIEQAGKIYFRNGFMFINEFGKGVHIINNTNPANPVNVAFINIPGNFDIAVADNILYADSYLDLLAIDISDMNNPTIQTTVENVFDNYNSFGFYVDAELGVVTEWVPSNAEDRWVSACESTGDDALLESGGVWFADAAAMPAVQRGVNFQATPNQAPGGGIGIAGSMARFGLTNTHLYTVSDWQMKVFDVTARATPSLANTIDLGWGIETIFPYGEALFLGARDGMHIYSIEQPEAPHRLSFYAHINSCDPVVVEGNTAYVTLRSGNACAGFTNQLDVVDVTNLSSPSLIATHPMQNPHGLGIDNGTLFITEGDGGLKVFDAADPLTIGSSQLAHFTDLHAFDVIPFNNVLMLIGEDGFYQYDYADLDNITLLSHIPVTPPAQ